MNHQSYLDFHFDYATPEGASILDETPLWSAPFGWKLLDVVCLNRVSHVLDIGCGTGFPLLELAGRLGETTRVIGLDPWEGGLARTRVKISAMQLSNVELHAGVAESLPFTENQFDLIVSNNGFNNVEDISLALREARRVAKTGAQLVFTMNTEGTFRIFYDIYETVLRNFGVSDAGERIAAHIHHKRIPLKEIESLLSESGFRVDQLLEDEFCYRFANGSAMLNHFFIKIAFLEPWAKLCPDGIVADVLETLEARLNAIAESSGELRMIVPFALFDAVAV